MAQPTCGASVQACALRVATLDNNGVPLPGAGKLYVTDALTSLEATPVYFAGTDMEVTNACGNLCVTYKSRDQLKRYDLTLSLCDFDPELEIILAGGQTFTLGGQTIGSSTPAIGSPGATNGVSLELWSKHIVNGDIDGTYPYIRWVLPRAYLQPDTITWNNDHMPRNFTGYTSQNPNWYNGPANDWTYSSDRSIAWAYATTLPATACGWQSTAAS